MCVGVNSALTSIKFSGSYTIFGKNIIDIESKVVITEYIDSYNYMNKLSAGLDYRVKNDKNTLQFFFG